MQTFEMIDSYVTYDCSVSAQIPSQTCGLMQPSEHHENVQSSPNSSTLVECITVLHKTDWDCQWQ